LVVTASSTMTDETIYVPLLDEGLDVRRPVRARLLSRDRYLILEQEYDRDIETWAYEPGTVVECRSEFRNGRELLVAVRAVERNKRNSRSQRRLVWKGKMRVSLVSCPVRLYAATAKGSDRPDELRAEAINIDCFVEQGQIEPVYLNQMYYLAPDGAVAEETFNVLLEAMRLKRVAAVSSVSFQTTDRKIALFTGRKVLRVHVLRNKLEVLEERLFAAGPEAARPDQEMLTLAGQLIEKKKGTFLPLEEPPEVRQEIALNEGIRSGKIVSLREALKKSIEIRRVATPLNNRRTGGSR
jgi:hypothetical protein